ncbi:hypothetical protein [Kitasatospora sp. GP82]|uniref:hypothetical protein n=1 Tax=Kitasatospora sp. GP82 TaxID=3035089 RepID=UPI002475815A|nr:hypothetical protein [Kitasatospora sp. GP82]MDH6130368.1 hypothetical protein [Kitasatospora sp. GP82]
MKYRTERRSVAALHTRDGITAPITRTETVRVPVPPRDWETIGLRVAVGVVIALTLVSIVWSTVSIGNLLAGGTGYAAGSIFDAAWIVCITLELLARYEPEKRVLPQRLGWVLLAVTMVAIAGDGWASHAWGQVAVGPLVSLVAKILWQAVMHHIHRELSDDDLAWMHHQRSEAHLGLALAGTRRQVARVRAHAAAELLAMEQAGYPAEVLTAEVVAPPVVPTRSQATLDDASDGILADSVYGTEASETTVSAIDAARADGWTVREIYAAAMAARPVGVTRSDDAGYLPRMASGQVSTPSAAPPIRPGFQSERVPEQPHRAEQTTSLSLATAVRVLMTGGVTDRDKLQALLPPLVGKPYLEESLDREIRKWRPRADE